MAYKGELSIEKALEQYEPMIHSFLKGAKCNAVCTYEDLVQEGRAAIVVAYRNYDSEKGASFTTWVYHMVKDAIIEYQKHHLSILSGGQYLHNIIRKAGEDASTEDIMSLGVSKKTAQQATVLRQSYATAPLDELSNYIGADDGGLNVDTLNWRSALTPIEARIIGDLYGFNGDVRSPKEVAKDLKISPKSVIYHREKALAKLRHLPGIEAYYN